ncbi:MAG: permease-like cell division protein FtsX [Nocardioidaceae bacterium]
MTYVFSDLATGLKRNVSMVLSVIVTIAVSMTLVGIGLLLNTQVAKAEETLGSKLQVVVYLCNERSTSPNCVSGPVTERQKAELEDALDQSKYVDFYRHETQQDAYRKFQQIYVSDKKTEQRYYNQVKPEDLKESYWITLFDPQDYGKVGSLVEGLPGVDSVQDLRDVLDPLYNGMNRLQQGALWLAALLVISAVLQVSNTIRLAAFARRREIGIMRLVGASSWYIQLPFLLESVIAALFGVGFACAALFGLMKFFIYPSLHGESQLMAWVDWSDALVAMGWITVGGLALAIVPTLIMTRKYLRV